MSVGHYRQSHEHLDLSQTVVDYLHRQVPDELEQSARDLAGAFLFSGLDQDKPLKVLSGGERSRAILAGFVAGGHNLLVLDEPTNHLDIPSSERLEELLRRPEERLGREHQRGGTLIVITHDRMLLDNLTDQLVIFDGYGHVPHFRGTYIALLESEQAYRVPSPPPRARSPQTAQPAGPPTKDHQQTDQQNMRTLGRLKPQQLEAKIVELEKQLTDIDQNPADQELCHDAAQVPEMLAKRDELTNTLVPIEQERLRRVDGD